MARVSTRHARPLPGGGWTDGASLRFTRSKDNKTIYCHALQWPGNTLTISHFERGRVDSAEPLGYPGKLPSRWGATLGLVIDIRERIRHAANHGSNFAWTFRLSRSA